MHLYYLAEFWAQNFRISEFQNFTVCYTQSIILDCNGVTLIQSLKGKPYLFLCNRSTVSMVSAPQVWNSTSAFATGGTYARRILALVNTISHLETKYRNWKPIWRFSTINNNLRDRNCIPRVNETCLNSCSKSSSYRIEHNAVKLTDIFFKMEYINLLQFIPT